MRAVTFMPFMLLHNDMLGVTEATLFFYILKSPGVSNEGKQV